MDIQEVCTRLGLKDVDELAGLLDFSDRSDKIWQLTKKVVDCQNYTQIKLLLEDSGLELDGSTSSPSSFYRQGWAYVLKSFSREQQSKEERKKLKNPSGFPKGNVPKGLESEWYFHRGHILAYSFAKTLTPNYRLLNSNYEWEPTIYWNQDITNKKDRNLFTQFNVANKLQGGVEQEVRELFEDGVKEIFYEVKIIKHRKDDFYAIGTEIYYKVIVPKDDGAELDEGHYFIPNLDQGFYIEDANVPQLYRDFYAEGYKKEKHRKYFKDSDREQRNWQNFENDVCTINNNQLYLIKRDRDGFLAIYNSLDKAISELENFEKLTSNIEELDYHTVFIFSNEKSEIKEVDAKLKKYNLVIRSNRGKYFYSVESGSLTGIFSPYGKNEKIHSKNDHFGSKYLDEEINKLKW